MMSVKHLLEKDETKQPVISFKKDDDYETPKYIWEMICNEKFISKNKKLYDPFYCRGNTASVMKELGYECIHPDEDFFTNHHRYEYDILLSNIPFSIKKKVYEELKKIDKPFIVISPISTITKKYFMDNFKHDDISIIIPPKRMQFMKNGKQLKECWFDTVFICYKMDLNERIIYI
jgi:hypothetical protein